MSLYKNKFGECAYSYHFQTCLIFQMKDLEISSLKKRVSELESQLEEAKKLIQKHLLEVNEVDLLKMKSADTLTKAKSVIFENTKMIKNQELQIDALNQQVESLRDVVKITKELLEIRNLEVDQLEAKIHCMDEKYKAEKERQDLMHKRLEQMIRHNGELKREYETQLCLFKALRERYDERELAKGLVDNLKSEIKIEKGNKTDQNETVNNSVQQEQLEKPNDIDNLNDQNKILPESEIKSGNLEEEKNLKNAKEKIEINNGNNIIVDGKSCQDETIGECYSVQNQNTNTSDQKNSIEKQEGQNNVISEDSKNIQVSDDKPNLDSNIAKE